MHLEAHPFAAGIVYRRDLQLLWIVNGIKGHLGAIGRKGLAEVALLVQQSDPDDRHPEITGCLS